MKRILGAYLNLFARCREIYKYAISPSLAVMTLNQKLVDSALAGIRADLSRNPVLALSALNNMAQSSLGKIDTDFPYRQVFPLRLAAYWNLTESADMAARRAMEFGMEEKAQVHRQRVVVYGELRAAEVALHHGETSQAIGSFLLAEAMAAGAGINLSLSFQQLKEFYFWARHL